MLKELYLENFRSLSSLSFDLCGKDRKPLKFIAIYGENGSGKTNLLQAISFLRYTLFSDIKPCSGDLRVFSRQYHMIGSEDPMVTRFVFEIDGSELEYCMSFIKDGTIIEESLSENHRNDPIFLFRCCRIDGKSAIDIRNSLFNESDSYILRNLMKDSWGDRTFLSILREQLDYSSDWIISEILQKVIGFISRISTAIEGEPSQLPIDPIKGKIEISNMDTLSRLEYVYDKFFARAYSDIRGAYYKTYTDGEYVEYRLFLRKMVSGQVREIPFEFESEGTKILLRNLHPVLESIRGCTAIIDYIDCDIHDLMLSGVLDGAIPEINGQLIVSLHNMSLLHSLDPSSVFILNVDAEGNKSIDPLVKIEKTRKNTNIYNRYRNGVYGGIPYLGHLSLPELLEDMTQ